MLEFTTQKNIVCGKKIDQGASGEPLIYPTESLLHQILYLKENNDPPTDPLVRIRSPSGKWKISPPPQFHGH